MANRYNVTFDGRPLALAHVLPHPRYAGQLMISIIPRQKKDEPNDGTDGIRMKSALYGKCPDTEKDAEAILALLADAGFKPEKVALTPIGRR